jgi:hypothetical protein
MLIILPEDPYSMASLEIGMATANRRKNGSGNDQPVYAARLGPCDSGRSRDTVAVDGVLHLLGYRISRTGGRPKHRTESACQTESITEVHRLPNL